MKIALIALLVGLIGLVQASSDDMNRFAPTISGGARCELGRGCLVPYGQKVVCGYDQRQEVESLRQYVEQVTKEKLSDEEEERLVRALGHYTQFKLKVTDWPQVLKELTLKKPFDHAPTRVQVQQSSEDSESQVSFRDGWSIEMDSRLLNASKTYACCLEVTIEEKYLRRLKTDIDSQFVKICTRIKFTEHETVESQFQSARDHEDNASAYRKLRHMFNDLTRFVKSDTTRHSQYFVPLVLATVAMVILVAISTAFCIVTVVCEVCCTPARSKRQRLKAQKRSLRLVNEDSFQFDHPEFATSTSAINLPCTITEYLRQIESSPTTNVINIRQQQEIAAPPSYMDSIKTSGQDEHGFNMTMKF